MKKIVIGFIAVALIAATVALSGCTAQEPVAGDIMEVAVEDGRFTSFVGALNETNLSRTLRENGPFTVFAPTDQAINALPEETREALFGGSEENVTRLLQYHIVPGRYRGSDVAQLNQLTTMDGDILAVNATNGIVFVDGIQVNETDIVASNGLIHAIDGVMIPPDQ
jgi:uncharacterized surface protein with fasciclin (FAS1) repeats